MGGRGQRSMSSKLREKAGQKDHLSGEEIPDSSFALAQYLGGVSEPAAQEMADAVKSFTGDDYKIIRAVQNGAKTGSPAERRLAEMCEEYIEHAPKWEGGTTYRGINVPPSKANSYVKGAILDVNRGTASWSSTLATAEEFSTHGYGVQVVFACETQRNGTSIRHLSSYKSENEVLVSKKSRYEVTHAGHQGSVLFVTVKEV